MMREGSLFANPDSPADQNKSPDLRLHKYTPNDFVAEDTLERKVKSDRKNYYDDVIASVPALSENSALLGGEL